MRRKLFCFLIAFSFYNSIYSQTTEQDTLSAKTLHEVVVRGYEQNRKLQESGAPISVVSQKQLQSFGNTSILPAINSVPGVRMEERSPGSYRLNIRGSSLRSPFGVRNVKIYYNGIPFTDPGGNTYLNELSFYNFSSLEILKGPGSSLYGAGTGGVMLINSTAAKPENQLSINYSRGSYNANMFNISANTGSESFQNVVSYTHQGSDGYREQSGMRRDIISWDSKVINSEKQSLSAHVLLGDLYYQTPGGLTLAQFQANPKAARPAGGGFPSAVQNKAAINQKMAWAGFEHTYNFSDHFKNSTSVYGATAQITNSAIRNYEKRLEPNFGGRTTFTYSTDINQAKLAVIAGAEYQQGFSTIKVYKNKSGNPDLLQTDDEVISNQATIFAQADLALAKGWIVTAGLSVNSSMVEFNRLSVVPSFNYRTDYNNQVAPRLSLLKKLNENASVYAVVSKGFSPPTVAELLPSTSVINTDLQAEKGTNYEVGFRSSLFANRLFIDVNAFSFRLQNSITQRRDGSGADFFTNAGNTKQRGIEAFLNYYISRGVDKFITANAWSSYSYHNFRYNEFKQLTNDFSNNKIPGVAPHTLAAGFNIDTKPGLYLNANSFYSAKIPLNDANAAFANSYFLLGFRAGFKRDLSNHINAGFFINGDNILNKTYSLGNDINAAANRFYNAAAGKNFMIGISFQYGLKK